MPTRALATTYRTHLCGTLRLADAGAQVKLGGWVHRRRDLGNLVFLDLRDRSGLVQVSIDPSLAPREVVDQASSLGPETVVLVEGEVVARPESMRNPELATGAVEVRATAVRVVGPAMPPAIPVARARGEPLPAEELRLRHRYLDLRRPELQENIVLRHALMQAARGYLSDQGFLEIETPILTKTTPEGARDYLVPSRVHPGEFYALPQSPQLYKQLLMVAGFDRYFQIARCFRDEDLRADRQPEFTQIDIEASFVTRDDIFDLGEGLLVALWKAGGVTGIARPFARMSHRDALERYGTDRPDLRFELELRDATALFRGAELPLVRAAIDAGGRVRAIVVAGGAVLSRKQLDELQAVARSAGAAALLFFKRVAGAVQGGLAKSVTPEMAERLGVGEGDLALLIAGPDTVTNPALDRVRQDVARRLGLVREGEHRFLWVTDFPLFAVAPDTGAIMPEHHPFTAPHPDDLALLDSDPARARSEAYDAVYNGVELASGSIRISDPRLQSRIFDLLGIDDATAQARFGFLLEGLRAGAPPHGGIAFGFDRITMLLAHAGSLRDVIAFPKTTAARALFEGAPSPVNADELEDLHISVEGVIS
ncbi:MAG TPA: aspartate--tRNA ligase [Gemmatimonadaceae bacterium]|nr:aspartate--tRNA ligase [Gemmatimonadaceae bacterium]